MNETKKHWWFWPLLCVLPLVPLLSVAMAWPAGAGAAGADQAIETIVWAEEASKEASPLSRLVADGVAELGADGILRLTLSEAGAELLLWESSSVSITEPSYALGGEVRYEGIGGNGMLELLSLFSEGEFFSRTAGDRGPLAPLKGDSDWRGFVLPFDASAAKETPQRLRLRLLAPTSGTVELTTLTLREGASMAELFPSYGGPQARIGWWGGVLGTTIGLLGAAIGVLAGQGRARSFVFASCWVLLAFGLFAVAVGIGMRVGWFHGSTLPWMSLGIASVTLPILLLPMLRRRYSALELRKMKAMDISV